MENKESTMEKLVKKISHYLNEKIYLLICLEFFKKINN